MWEKKKKKTQNIIPEFEGRSTEFTQFKQRDNRLEKN